MRRVLDQIEQLKLVPVVKINNIEDAVPLAQALCKGGLPVAEVTFRTACAREAIAKMTKEVPELLVGAGTVLTTKQVDDALEAGAAFVVAPGFNEKVVRYCLEKGIPILPGCSHASDIERAIECGLEVVKFFPAKELGGIHTIKALAAPYQQVRFMPTGGVTEDSLDDYLECKSVIACGGSWMVKESLISDKQFGEIEALTRKAVERIQASKPTREVVMQANTVAEVAVSEIDVVNKTVESCEKVAKGVASFGELLLRLSTPGYLRFQQARDFAAHFGGAEANVAVALANFGMESKFITKLPTNEVAQSAINELRKFGVDTSSIARGGERMGIYFLEKGASQRSSKVIYDRSHSSISEACEEDFDWEQSLKNVQHFFITGITPALGEHIARLCLEVCKKCKEKDITVWCDLNYREKLWTKTEARKTLQALMKYVDVCITNEHHASDILEVTPISEGTKEENLCALASQMANKYGFKQIALTIRESLSASDNNLSAMLYQDGQSYFAKRYPMHIVDRVGGGDAFAAGLIYARANEYGPQEAVEFGAAAECLKHTIEGDFNYVSKGEVEALATGDGLGLVQR
ncbi:MAG: KHG/KDPG aldolase/sugar kinase fusion protein [Niameybacter sp.]